MASDKKPSIYSDRGTIGSSDELDEYGVWVKTEPQDLSLASMTGAETQETSDISTEISEDTSSTDDLDFSIPDIADLPDFDTLQEEASKNAASKEDFDLPEFGTDEESFDSGGESFDLGDLAEQPDSVDSIELEETGEDLDIPDFSETGTTTEEDEVAADDGFTEISMDDFIGTLDTEPAEEPAENSLPVESEVSIEHSDISVEPEEVQESSPAVSAAATGPEKGGGSSNVELSTQLLMQIAEELSSIRKELSSLKKEFSEIKTTAPAAEAAESGFFGKEDDEKIALTGDELNNILNTADFTEEAGADATMELSEDLPSEELSPEVLSIEAAEDTADDMLAGPSEPFEEEEEAAVIEPDTGNPQDDVSPSDEPDLSLMDFDINLDETEMLESEPEYSGETEDTVVIPEFVEEETEELKYIRENGAEPMAFALAPEDETYLTEEPPAELQDEPKTEPIDEHFPDGSIDLSEAIIDEPDLSSEIQDNPLEEPSLDDISINLDLADLASAEQGAGEPDSGESFPTEIEEDGSIVAFEESDTALPEISEEEMELPLDISISETELQSVEEAEDEAAEDEIPLSPDTDNAEEGGDLSLIPEGFLVEASDDSSAPDDVTVTDDFSVPDDSPAPDDLTITDDFSVPDDLSAPDDLTITDDLSVPDDSSSDASSLEDLTEEVISQSELDKLENETAEPEESTIESRAAESIAASDAIQETSTDTIPTHLKHELKTVLSYMDQLLESLPDEKIEEFARSKYYDTYKKLFKELGLV